MKQQKLLQGRGSLDGLVGLLKQLNVNRVLLITGKRSFDANTGRQPLLSALEGLDGLEYRRFSDFEINPKYEDVQRGVELFHDFAPELIIAMGGGTVMDMAKLINALAEAGDEAPAYIRGQKKIEKTSVPLMALPTTSGTGSEATHFAVVYLEGKKYSLAHGSILPDYVVLDPELTTGMSPFLTAYSGMDALCQGIESYWSVNSTEESLGYARQAVETAIAHIEPAVKAPDLRSREAMQRAAYYSGKGINITKTTAAHAFSYHLTSTYGIPHGQAVGLLIGWVFENNLGVTADNCLDQRGPDFVKARLAELRGMLGMGENETAEEYFDGLLAKLGLRADNFELNEQSKQELFRAVNVERLKNNPVKVEG